MFLKEFKKKIAHENMKKKPLSNDAYNLPIFFSIVNLPKPAKITFSFP